MIIYKGNEANQMKYTERRIISSDCSMVVGDRNNFLYRKYADILRDRGYRVMKIDCPSEYIGFNPRISYDNLYGTVWNMTEFFIKTKNEYYCTAEKHLLHTACMYALESSKGEKGIFDYIKKAVELLDTIIKSKDYYSSDYYISIREFAKKFPVSETAESFRAISFIPKKAIRNIVAEITMQMIFSNFTVEEPIDLSVLSEEKTILFINRSYNTEYFDRVNAYVYHYIVHQCHSDNRIEIITDFWNDTFPFYCCRGQNNIEITLLTENDGLKGNTLCIMK